MNVHEWAALIDGAACNIFWLMVAYFALRYFFDDK